MSTEDEARNLVVELRALEGSVEALRSRLGFLSAALNELNTAKSTLQGLAKEKAEAPLFVPIGGGSYIKAKLEDSDRVIYGVGAGVAIEKTLQEAEEGVSKRISEIEKTRETLERQLSQVLRRIQESQARLQELSAELRGRERK